MSATDAHHARVARRYRVSGRVQGVGFRWFVREQARALGIAGLVKNLPDGTVLVQAFGTPPGLARLEEALRRGPRGAHVERVDVDPEGEALAATTGLPPFPFAIERAE